MNYSHLAGCNIIRETDALILHTPTPTHLNQMSESLSGSGRVWWVIWIRCVRARKHLKHAGQTVGPWWRTMHTFTYMMMPSLISHSLSCPLEVRVLSSMNDTLIDVAATLITLSPQSKQTTENSKIEIRRAQGENLILYSFFCSKIKNYPLFQRCLKMTCKDETMFQ